ncbi:MAG: hypothetical protein WEB50_15650 [Vicinamibacterales bacterium]
MRAIAVAVIWSALVGIVAAQDTSGPSTALPPSPPEPVITWGAEVDVVSKYVWRGFPYSQGKVVWPSAWVSARGVTVSLFTNIEPGYDPALNEYDISVTYERTVGRLTVAATYVRYAYGEGALWLATTELVGRAGYAVGPGEIFASHAFDVDLYRGSSYLEAGYAFTRELGSKSTLSVDATVAFWSTFIEKYAGVSNSTIGPLSVNVACTRQLARHFSVRPHVTLSRIPDARVRILLNPPAATFGLAAVLEF